MRVFEAMGYEACDDRQLEASVEKIAIYAKDGVPTHMARQLPSGDWTSKCGAGEDITHTLVGLEGDLYGAVSVVMRRKAER